MNATLGQVASGVVLALAIGSQAGAQTAAMSTANTFLSALDRGDPGAATKLTGPYATSAQIQGIVTQRQAVPQGGIWGAGRQLVGQQAVGPDSVMLTYRTTYKSATKLQQVVVDCAGGCKVKAFTEKAQ